MSAILFEKYSHLCIHELTTSIKNMSYELCEMKHYIQCCAIYILFVFMNKCLFSYILYIKLSFFQKFYQSHFWCDFHKIFTIKIQI